SKTKKHAKKKQTDLHINDNVTPPTETPLTEEDAAATDLQTDTSTEPGTQAGIEAGDATADKTDDNRPANDGAVVEAADKVLAPEEKGVPVRRPTHRPPGADDEQGSRPHEEEPSDTPPPVGPVRDDPAKFAVAGTALPAAWALLTPAAVKLWATLLYLGAQGRATLKDLAELSGLSERTLHSALRDLQGAEFLTFHA